MRTDKAELLELMDKLSKNASDASYVKAVADGKYSEIFAEAIRSGDDVRVGYTDGKYSFLIDTERGRFSLPMDVFNTLNQNAVRTEEVSSKAMHDSDAYEDKKKEEDEQPGQKVPIDACDEEHVQVAETFDEENVEHEYIAPQEYAQTEPEHSTVSLPAEDHIITDREESCEQREPIYEEEYSGSEMANVQPEIHEIKEQFDVEGNVDTVEREPITEPEMTEESKIHAEEVHEAVAETHHQSEEDHYIQEMKIPEPEVRPSESEMIETPVLGEEEPEPVQEKPKKKGFFGFAKKESLSAQPETAERPFGKYAALSSEPEPVKHSESLSNAMTGNDDGGEIFKHTHSVSIVLKFNNDNVRGRYSVEFWPTWIQFKSGLRAFADCVIRVTDDDGTEHLGLIDSKNREFKYKPEGTDYVLKMVGIWEYGSLLTSVSIDNDSKYAILDDIEKNEPEDPDSSFLLQFKKEEKGQPSYFIIPLRNSNRGESCIPIIGIVNDGGQKFILSRMKDNTCRHVHNNRERVISGHWENGHFAVSVN